jgi:IS5 family transposase
VAENQLSFSSLDYAAKKKRTKREVFLARMAAVLPWVALEALIDPFFPKMGRQGGRRAFPLATMLRIYCLQQCHAPIGLLPPDEWERRLVAKDDR